VPNGIQVPLFVEREFHFIGMIPPPNEDLSPAKSEQQTFCCHQAWLIGRYLNSTLDDGSHGETLRFCCPGTQQEFQNGTGSTAGVPKWNCILNNPYTSVELSPRKNISFSVQKWNFGFQI
jgi:hypothetical protein